MRFLPFHLPDERPFSLWFFAITLVVYLLQRVPVTGVFLMVVGAAFWSVLLINLGMAGLVVEGVSGRVSPLWLVVPAVYLGGYYWAYRSDQLKVEIVAAEVEAFNAGKSLPFDVERHDLVVGDAHGGSGIGAGEFTQRFGVPRAFGGQGRMFMVGTAQSCALLKDKPVFQSAGIQAHPITRQGERRWQKLATGFCSIMMPGKPDKPIVRVTEQSSKSTRGRLPVALRMFTALDEGSGASAAVQTGTASPLKRFPMPVMGCALNSGAGSWDCFAGFMRDTVQLPRGLPLHAGALPVIARMLGLTPSDDLGAVAIGPERFKPMADRADGELLATELAALDAILANPLGQNKHISFRHLSNRPEVLAPLAGRIFDALGILQRSDAYASSNGGELWSLVAVLPEPALAPHRAQMVEYMMPGAIRPWTDNASRAFVRLDIRDPVQRDIVLGRLENPLGDISTILLPAFCRMGATAPDDAKRRLLAIWRARGEVAAKRTGGRGYDHVRLYLALARMGLKEEAGKVEQRYMGSSFAGIWDEVTPDTPDDICGLEDFELSNRFRQR